MVSVDGNLYSVPDTTRKRQVEVQRSATEIRIIEQGQCVACHPLLTGRGQRRLRAGAGVRLVVYALLSSCLAWWAPPKRRELTKGLQVQCVESDSG